MEKTRDRQAHRLALAVGAALLAAALSMTIGVGTALASPYSIKDFNGKVYSTYTTKGETCYYSWPNGTKKISSAKSSNTKVATVAVNTQKMNGKTYTSLKVTRKAVGTAKITYKLAGKTKKVTLVVSKYVNPLKSLKVGSKNLTKKFNKTRQVTVNGTLSGQVSFAAKSGWTVKVYVYDRYNPTGKAKAVKSGYKLKGDEDISYIMAKKGKITEYLYVYGY